MKRWYRVLCLFLSLPMMAHAGIPQSDNTTLGTPEQRVQWEAEFYMEHPTYDKIRAFPDLDKIATVNQFADKIDTDEFTPEDYSILVAIADIHNDVPAARAAYIARGLLKTVYNDWGQEQNIPQYVYLAHLLEPKWKKSHLYLIKILKPLVQATRYTVAENTARKEGKPVIQSLRKIFEEDNNQEALGMLAELDQSLLPELKEAIAKQIQQACISLQAVQQTHPADVAKFNTVVVHNEMRKAYGGVAYDYDLVMERCSQ